MPLLTLVLTDKEDRIYIEKLYRRFCYRMCRVARKYAQSPADVEDIVSDSCIHLLLKRHTLERLNAFQLQRYVAKVVQNEAINFYKRERRENGFYRWYHLNSQPQSVEDCSLEKEVLLNEQIRLLRNAIAQLPEKERQALYLKIHDGKEDAEIAEKIGIAEGSVRKYISRARQRLREELGKEDWE